MPAPLERDSARPFSVGDESPIGTIAGFLGQGASGFVYEVRVGDDRRALKVYDRWVTQREDSAARLARETSILKSIEHSNVCRAFGSGSLVDPRDQKSMLNYVVLEYVCGRNLEEVVGESGPLETNMVRQIVLAIADALGALHSRGIVHRDVKPANVLLEEQSQRVVLMDFGVARAAEDETVTERGDFLGTRQFGAPEWIWRSANESMKEPSLDVYSLGATMLYLASGKLPFAGVTNVAQLMTAIRDQPPVLSYDGVPAWMRTLVASMMSKRPQDRPSLTDVIQSLRELGENELSPTPRVAETSFSDLRDALARHEQTQRVAEMRERAVRIESADARIFDEMRRAWAPVFEQINEAERGKAAPLLRPQFGNGIDLERWANASEVRSKFQGFAFEPNRNVAVLIEPLGGVTVALCFYLGGGPDIYTMVRFVAEHRGYPNAGDIDLSSCTLDSGVVDTLVSVLVKAVPADQSMLILALRKMRS